MLVRFSITFKILAGYVFLAILLGAVSYGSLHVLHRIAENADTVAQNELEVLVLSERLQSGLTLLDLYQGKYLETTADDLLEQFDARKVDFEEDLRHLSDTGAEPLVVGQIAARYEHYLDLFAEQIDLLRRDEKEQARQQTFILVRQQAGQLFSLIDDLVVRARTGLGERFRTISGVSRRSSQLILAHSLFGLCVGLVIVLLAARHLSVSLNKLKKAMNLIGEGAFDFDAQISSADEMGDLAHGLKIMAQKFKGYEQLCLDASPLTRLPGNIAIERALMERIRRNEKFALCYADLDDFKAYNDRYGYAKGSEIIKKTGEILYEAKRVCGGPDDFIGHIGGDDFVLITSPEYVKEICEHIIRNFDSSIPEFYSAEDRRRGFVEGVDHYGIERHFPVMTISIAVVSDARRDIQSPTEIARVAAEIKEFVKTIPGSNYLVDRRRESRSS